MENYQFFTLIAMLAGGFGWLIIQISDLKVRVGALELRLGFVERMIEMIGSPFRFKSTEKDD